MRQRSKGVKPFEFRALSDSKRAARGCSELRVPSVLQAMQVGAAKHEYILLCYCPGLRLPGAILFSRRSHLQISSVTLRTVRKAHGTVDVPRRGCEWVLTNNLQTY